MALTPRVEAGRWQSPCGPARSQVADVGSDDPGSVSLTDLPLPEVCFTKKSICEWLQISTRTWDRLAAAGLTPPPDLVVGKSARWSPLTVAKWLRSKPRLPGRKGGGRVG
jgi:hypothetical protein